MMSNTFANFKRIARLVSYSWQKFWFEPIEVLPLAAFRVFFATAAFIFYSLRLLEFPFLFSDKGILPYAIFRDAMPAFYAPVIPWGIIATPSLAFALHLLFLACLLALALGLLPRIGIIVTFLLHLCFVDRNPLCIYGADQVACCWLFYLCFTRSNDYLSIRFVKSASRPDGLLTDPLTTLGYRLIQIQLCVIYAYSGLTKLQGSPWWHGDAIWDILANGQLVSVNFNFLQHFTLILTLMNFLVLFWESYFPFLVWNPVIRLPTLAVGVLLHALIGLTMGIPFFSLFMIASYLLWIEPGRIQYWVRK